MTAPADIIRDEEFVARATRIEDDIVKIFYSPAYDISCFGLEKLHPFDSCKYGHAWKILQREFGEKLETCHTDVNREISRQALLRVHSASYLDHLKSSKYIASALELPFLANIPFPLLDRQVLRPMRLATQGTVQAAEAALSGQHAVTVNMSGGYHHASRDRGEGFCLYADVYVAIEALRDSEKLDRVRDRILYIDLDAHQGNGVERVSEGDRAIRIFDMYNCDIYPNDAYARRLIHYDLPIGSGTGDRVYLDTLRNNLDIVFEEGAFALAFYNAGTDVFANDLLGGLNLSSDAIYERDCLILDNLRDRHIPCVMVPSGGYSAESHQLLANTVIGLVHHHLAT